MTVSAVPAHAGLQAPPFAASPSTLAMSSQRTLDASMLAAANISITTDEGDRVTLSSAVRQALSIDESVYLASGEQGLEAQFARSESRSESADFAMQVDGDLNADERRDIQRLMDAIGKIVDKFFRGDADGAMKGAMKAAEKLGNLESLSGFDVSARLEYEVTASSVTRAATTGGQPEGGDVPTSIAAPAPPASESSVTQPSSPVPAQPAAASVAPAVSVSDAEQTSQSPAVDTSAPAQSLIADDADAVAAGDDETPTAALDQAAADLRALLERNEFSQPKLRDLVPAMILDAIDQLREGLEQNDDDGSLDTLEQRLLETVRDTAQTGFVYESRFSTELTESYSMTVSAFA